MPTSVASITHPDYDVMVEEWDKYRLTFKGGRDFIEEYLRQYSVRENLLDFALRRDMTYCPAHAKAMIMEVKNSIFQRLNDIARMGGPENYVKAIAGEDGGVDFSGKSMTHFFGQLLLPELLTMAKVGVYVDKFPVEPGATITEQKKNRPYLYIYTAEAIRSWTKDTTGRYTSLLLQDVVNEVDPDTGLTTGTRTVYRLLNKVVDGVIVTMYDEAGKEESSHLLAIDEIPFVCMEISSSLLTDVADYQISLLNMASGDVHYALKSNFPFYTEQYEPKADMAFNMAPAAQDTDDATAATAAKARDNEITVGSNQGRRYAQGLERPGFIHPSSEPLKASMDKQEQLKAEIRQLVNLNIASLSPMRSSAESKSMDERGLEAGLSYIGLELEYGERAIARIWSKYEAYDGVISIKYPSNYSLKTDAERQEEGDRLRKLLPTIPSLSFQRAVAKIISKLVIGNKVSEELLADVNAEIDKATVVAIDPDVIKQDHEAGFVSTETASRARLYPEGEVKQAKIDHAERLARIAIAQSKGKGAGADPLASKARGTESQGDEGRDEKALSRVTDENETTHTPVRGEGSANDD